MMHHNKRFGYCHQLFCCLWWLSRANGTRHSLAPSNSFLIAICMTFASTWTSALFSVDADADVHIYAETPLLRMRMWYLSLVWNVIYSQTNIKVNICVSIKQRSDFLNSNTCLCIAREHWMRSLSENFWKNGSFKEHLVGKCWNVAALVSAPGGHCSARIMLR